MVIMKGGLLLVCFRPGWRLRKKIHAYIHQCAFCIGILSMTFASFSHSFWFLHSERGFCKESYKLPLWSIYDIWETRQGNTEALEKR